MDNAITYNPVLFIFVSYTLGIFAVLLIQKLGWNPHTHDHHYISNKLTRQLGVLHFGWLIRHSFMGKFNQKLKYQGKRREEDLQQLKLEMTYAEVGHLIAFLILLIWNIIMIALKIDGWYIIGFFFLNIVFNLYLVFLQQFNKRRIDKILHRG